MSLPNDTNAINESDDHHINKENTAPIISEYDFGTKQNGDAEVRVRVAGLSFLLDLDTVHKLNSELLNRSTLLKSSPSLQEQGSPWKNIPDEENMVVLDDADAECFSAFVHMARFGTLPTSIFSKEKRDLLLQQSDVWGIRVQVEEALAKARNDFRNACDCAGAIHRCLLKAPMSALPLLDSKARPFVPAASVNSTSASSSSASVASGTALSLVGPHHNFRRDDGSRRVFCSACGHRDIDWRYHIGDYYSSCQKCRKEITYKPDLGWCHKCRQCEDCQTTHCPGVPIRQLEEQVIPYMISSLKKHEYELSFF